MKLSRWILIILFILITTIAAILLAIYNSKADQGSKITLSNIFPQNEQSSRLSTQLNNVNFKIISQIPEYEIKEGSLNEEFLQKMLAKMELWPLDSVTFYGEPVNGQWKSRGETIRKISPTSITVTLLPQNQFENDIKNDSNLSARQLYRMAFSDDRVIATYLAGDLSDDKKSLNISIYVNPVEVSKFDQPTNIYLTKSILLSLFLNFQSTPVSTFDNPTQSLTDKVGVINSSLFELKTKNSLKNILEVLALLFSPKEIYAQNCNGAPHCGTMVFQPGTCSGSPSTSCSDDTDCIGTGPCIGEGNQCTSSGSTGSCFCSGGGCGVVGSSNFVCISSCPCTFSGGCTSSVIPGSTPAPTPAPTGPPPPGSCTSGDPFYGYNNCGDVGRVNGSGSCGAGCLCCATTGTFNPPSCSLGVHNGSLSGPLLNNGQNYLIPLNVNKLTSSRVSTNGFVQYINYYVSDITKSVLSPGPASKSYHFCDCVGSGCTNFYTGGACGNTNPQSVTTQYVHGLSTLTPYSVLTVTATCKGAGGTVQKIQTFNLVPFSNPAWWQTKGGDVMSGDDLTSRIPATCTGACIPDLILDAPSPQGSGYPGLAVYNTSYDFSNGTGSGVTSSKNWLAQSTYTGKIYDYNYFDTLVPSDVSFVNISGSVGGGTFVSQGTPNKGYVWFKSTGDLTINSNINLSARKVILLVNGNLTVQGPISVTDGQGFFMAIVSGTTSFDPSLGGSSGNPSVEGLFLSDGGISTGGGNVAFYERGSIVANGALNLQRDLGTVNNQTKPAEVFEYAPDMILNFPRSLARSRVIWQEVAP